MGQSLSYESGTMVEVCKEAKTEKDKVEALKKLDPIAAESMNVDYYEADDYTDGTKTEWFEARVGGNVEYKMADGKLWKVTYKEQYWGGIEGRFLEDGSIEFKLLYSDYWDIDPIEEAIEEAYRHNARKQ